MLKLFLKTHIIICLIFYIEYLECFLEKGKWTYIIDKNTQYLGVSKILYNNSKIRVSVKCNNPGYKVKLSWLLRLSPCGDEYSYIYDKSDLLMTYFNNPELKPLQFPYDRIEYQQSESSDYNSCDKGYLIIKDESSNGHQVVITKESGINTQKTGEWIKDPAKKNVADLTNGKGGVGGVVTDDPNKNKLGFVKSTLNAMYPSKEEQDQMDEDIDYTAKSATYRRLPAPEEDAGNFVNRMPSNSLNISRSKRRAKIYEDQDNDNYPGKLSPVTSSWKDGNYLFILLIEIQDGVGDDTVETAHTTAPTFATVNVDMAGPSGQYLSVHDWPLLPFYACMCALYTLFIFVWGFWSIYYFRELLRIQYWISAVIFLGFLEKTLFLGEYHTVNTTGTSIFGALVFAEIVSALKRALSRILIIVASIGYGIVKPRLGTTMRKVVCLGLTYFLFASIEGSLRVSKSKANPTSIILFATIPVALCDAIICWQIFTGLVQTLRTLRLRHNLVKLSMYRHFTNILIFSVIVSIAFMLWSLREHKLITCIKKWRQLWLDDAFWHLLFSFILLAIIIIWRPSSNNQRYAFTPLLDGSDDETGNLNDDEGDDGDEREEFSITTARGSIKMRSKSLEDKKNSTAKTTSTEEDLRWIEDNIPPSIADAALPNILDSEEEENIKRFELGKMQ